MREGKLTLPLIRSLARASDKDREWMHRVIADPVFDQDRFEDLKEKLWTLGGIAYTQERANDHVEKAKTALGMFADSDSKALLHLIADYSIERKV